jgi:hypothetical protein
MDGTAAGSVLLLSQIRWTELTSGWSILCLLNGSMDGLHGRSRRSVRMSVIRIWLGQRLQRWTEISPHEVIPQQRIQLVFGADLTLPPLSLMSLSL